MGRVRELREQITGRVNINLERMRFDVRPHVNNVLPLNYLSTFCALCGLSPTHSLHFKFTDSALGGSYFLGHCQVESSIVFHSDLRGDELKRSGEFFQAGAVRIQLVEDEKIHVKDSLLIKTLVHSHSHDPNNPEIFMIHKSVALPYSNVHGSPVLGSFLGTMSTIDLTTVQDSIVGEFAYIQLDELAHRQISPGLIRINPTPAFDFQYQHDLDTLSQYVSHHSTQPPSGMIIDFVQAREREFETAFDTPFPSRIGEPVHHWSAVSPYAIVKGKCLTAKNVFVAQRAYLENAVLGEGSNAQENCFIIDSVLEGYNVTAHGGKIINTRLGTKVFVGFNSFLRGTSVCPLTIGRDSLVMPHTIIDLVEPVDIPPQMLIWGLIRRTQDLREHTLPLQEISAIKDSLHLGAMTFRGNGEEFVHKVGNRVEKILMENGAYYNGTDGRGHAQASRDIAFNIIQPFPSGDLEGLHPLVEIKKE